MPNVGPMELILLLIVLLLVFGPKRLPEMGRSVGRGIREFKDSVSGNEPPEDTSTPAVTTSPTAPATTTVEAGTPASESERVAS